MKADNSGMQAEEFVFIAAATATGVALGYQVARLVEQKLIGEGTRRQHVLSNTSSLGDYAPYLI